MTQPVTPEMIEAGARAICSGWGNPDAFHGKVDDAARRDANVAYAAMRPHDPLFQQLVEALEAVASFDWRNNREALLGMVNSALLAAQQVGDKGGGE